MTTAISTLAFQGIEVLDVKVETFLGNGIPNFILVGLADKTIAESKERVRAALNSLGLSLPAKRIVINLAPADLLKEGNHFDLAIACCLLANMGIIEEEKLKDYIILGELALDGSIRSIAGVLPAAIGANERGKGIICPKENGSEALWSGNENIIAAENLLAIVNHFNENQLINPPSPSDIVTAPNAKLSDFSDIKGLSGAKRALEIAASGGHNILMSGAPGAGKSMLASRLPSILPPLSTKEMLECSMIFSIAGLIKEGKFQIDRPYRSPHHSCSIPAMVGGGAARRITPGEITLAHNGVLFLDEFPEFPRAALDALRQPLENKNVFIARAGANICFPAKFQLVAAMNPCKCGYLDDDSRSCNKAPKCGIEYQTKISGPILDRIDIHIDVPSISPNDVCFSNSAETSAEIAKRVTRARNMQATRYQHLNFSINSDVPSEYLDDLLELTSSARSILNQAADTLKLSMRAYNRVMKLARTIADMDEAEQIYNKHVTEALAYRQIFFNERVKG